MSTFQSIASPSEARIPPGHVIVPRFAFAPEFLKGLPAHLRVGDDGVAIGLRMISDGDLLTARVQAARQAAELHPGLGAGAGEFEDTRRQIAIRYVVGFGTCDPNDQSAPCAYWPADPVEEVRFALSDRGMSRVFSAWERTRLAVDPGAPQLSDEQASQLAALVDGGALAALDPVRAARVRRLLAFCLEELTGEVLAG